MGGMSSKAAGQSTCDANICDDKDCCVDNGEATCIDCIGILVYNDDCGCKVSSLGMIIVIVLAICCLCGIAVCLIQKLRDRNKRFDKPHRYESEVQQVQSTSNIEAPL